MRIVKNIEDPTTRFDDLMIGDVFLDFDEIVCIKVPVVYNEFSGADTESLLEGCLSAETFYEHQANAYDLENHEFFWINDNTQVRPLNAYLEVK